MADYSSQLPVHTLTNGDVAVKVVDGTTVAQALAVDSAGNASVNLGKVVGTAADVNNGAVSAGTLRVTIASDSTGLIKLATGANTIGALTANQSVNSAQVSGTAVSVGNGTTDAGTTRVSLSSDSTGQVKLATGANTIGALTANQSVNLTQVAGASLALGQTTMSASVPVTFASNQSTLNVALASAGTLVTHYSTTAAVAAAGSATNSYTVTAGKTFTSCKFLATASGRLKATVSLNAVDTYVGFNSTANPNIIIDLGFNGATCAATQVVLITLVNEDNAAMNVYSTIIGTEA